MDCLINRIGISGCGAPTTPASAVGVTPVVEALPVLVINDLPGITLQNIEALGDEEDDSFLSTWRKVALRALKKFDIMVKAKLNQCYKLTDKTVVECLVCEKKDLFDVALWYLHGTELMIERTSTDTLSRYTTIDLDKAEQLKADFYNEFKAALNDAVTGIDPEQSTCITTCVECNDTVKFVMQTP